MRPLPSLTGPIPTLPTLFAADRVDVDAQARLCKRLVEAGFGTVLVGGLEGEGPTLSAAELAALVALSVDHAPIVGVSICASSTVEGCRQAEMASREGAAFLVVSPPPYNRPTTQGVRLHLEAIGTACDLSIVLRDDQNRTRVAVSCDTISRLIDDEMIAAVVLAPGDMRLSQRIDRLSHRNVRCLAGSDSDAVLMQCDDRAAWLSTLAIVDPRRSRALHHALVSSDRPTARRLSRELCGLLCALDLDEAAVTVKSALAQLGLAEGGVRLPLAPIAADAEEILAAAIRTLGLIEAPLSAEPC